MRSLAWSAFYRFRLTSPGEELSRLARQAVEETMDVSDAADKADLKRRSEQARRRIDDFASAAATHLAITAPVQASTAALAPAPAASTGQPAA
ncbi:MAG TPA: hypothetical protein VMA72_16390 [Streptosporangiaceae bacterium]|nr:hypothetical protein [Streptosporangiaceae bacterium]